MTFTAASAATPPEAALRAALSDAARQLAAAGGGPHHLTAMTWRAAVPAAYHPSRRTIDLAYRGVLGGFRPPVRLERGGAADGLVIEVEAKIPAPAPAAPVWGGYSLPDLARQYSPRGQVPDMGAVFAGWTAAGGAFRPDHAALDLAYGPSAAETLDLYLPAGQRGPAPVWAFIHGGYWQASTKEQHAQFAAGMLDAGFAVANIEYSLAPERDLKGIVAQIRAALSFLGREAAGLGIDAGRLHVAGHSAGGHLAAMAAVDPDGPPVRSALLLSGLFELEPLGLLPVGRLLGLDSAAAVDALSPARRPAPQNVRIGVAVGGLESDEFKRQSRLIAEAWGAPAPLVVAGAHHFDLLEGLISGDLLRLAIAVAADDATDPGGIATRQATPSDVDEIVALVDGAQDPDGAGLAQRMPPELVRQFIAAMPCIVARRGARVVGVLLAQPRPEGISAGAVTGAMLDAYPGTARSYVYGPIVVDASERGRGLAQRMARDLMQALPGREGILFIAAANLPSLQAHRKMGARIVADFTHDGRSFHVLVLG